jgi:hypothetical protein
MFSPLYFRGSAMPANVRLSPDRDGSAGRFDDASTLLNKTLILINGPASKMWSDEPPIARKWGLHYRGTSQARKNAPDRACGRSRAVGLIQLDTDRRALIVVRPCGSQGWTAFDPCQRGRRCASHYPACDGCRSRLCPPCPGERGLCLSLNAVVAQSRSPDERSDIRGYLRVDLPACRCAHAGYARSRHVLKPGPIISAIN